MKRAHLVQRRSVVERQLKLREACEALQRPPAESQHVLAFLPIDAADERLGIAAQPGAVPASKRPLEGLKG